MANSLAQPGGEDWLIKLHSGEIIGDGGKVLGLVAMTLTGLWLPLLH